MMSSTSTTTKGNNTNNRWTPAPEGMIWFDHPFLVDGRPRHLTDQQFFLVKRGVEFGLSNADFEHRMFEENFQYKYWCPVLKKSLNECAVKNTGSIMGMGRHNKGTTTPKVKC